MEKRLLDIREKSTSAILSILNFESTLSHRSSKACIALSISAERVRALQPYKAVDIDDGS